MWSGYILLSATVFSLTALAHGLQTVLAILNKELICGVTQ